MKMYDLVKAILTKDPKSRDDDKLLIWRVWGYEGATSGGSMNFQRFKDRATTPETITRARRQVQENHPELQASEHIKKARSDEEKKKGKQVYHKKVKTKYKIVDGLAVPVKEKEGINEQSKEE